MPADYAIEPSEGIEDESLDRIRQLVPMIQSTIAHHLDRELSNLLSNPHTICAITSKINDEVHSVIRTSFQELPSPPTTTTPTATATETATANATATAPVPAPTEPAAYPASDSSLLWDYIDFDGLIAQLGSHQTTSALLGGFFAEVGTAAGTDVSAYLGDTAAWGLDTTDESGFSDVFSGTESLVSGDTSVDESVRHLSPGLIPSAAKGKKPASEEYADG